MPKVLHIRGFPDEVHAVLARRADEHGQSLRQYVIEVLERHCSLPTMEEWLSRVDRLRPAEPKMSAADALRQAREEDDRHLTRGRRRR